MMWLCEYFVHYCYGLCVPGPRRDPELPDLVSLSGAAEILGLAKSYVHELHQTRKLPGVRVEGARYWVFRKQVVLALKAELDAKRRIREQPGDTDDGDQPEGSRPTTRS